MVPHRGGEPGAGECFRIAADERVHAEDRRQDDDAALGGRVGLREKAEQAGLLDVLRLGRHGNPFAVGYFERRRHSAAMDLASAASTAGMTFSAISSMDLRPSCGSAQSLPQ